MARHAHLDSPKWTGLRDAQGAPARARVGVLAEATVRGVEVQEVLPLHGEHDGPGVGRLAAEESLALGALEEEVEQTQGARRLGRDAGDARDVHVSALGA